MTLSDLNALPESAAADELGRCCGATRWVARMVAGRPYADATDLQDVARSVWRELSSEDWLEAFTHHPRIGDVDGLRKKFASTAKWAAGEQSGAGDAAEAVLTALATGNRDYEARFGHIFIVCATGKTAAEMLALLRARIGNAPDTELRIAAGEQEKITTLRLEKLLSP